MSYHHWIIVHCIQSLLFKCISIHPFWRLCSPALHHLKWHHQSLVFESLWISPFPYSLQNLFFFGIWVLSRCLLYVHATTSQRPFLEFPLLLETLEFLSYAYLDLFFLLYTSNLNSHSFFYSCSAFSFISVSLSPSHVCVHIILSRLTFRTKSQPELWACRDACPSFGWGRFLFPCGGGWRGGGDVHVCARTNNWVHLIILIVGLRTSKLDNHQTPDTYFHLSCMIDPSMC